MAVVGVDIGGTKIATGIFDESGHLAARRSTKIGKDGDRVPEIILSEMRALLADHVGEVSRAGICIPGIYYADRATVWAPNIPGWTDYPLSERLEAGLGPDWSIRVDSDRACYVLGEEWQGRAQGCRNVIFLAVGTGIGAGILLDGKVLRGIGDAAGAIGWMALKPPYRTDYDDCGCFEYHASGAGIARVARAAIGEMPDYDGILRQYPPGRISTEQVLSAYDAGDPISIRATDDAIVFWGMAVANLVSLFNPEMIIFGGGVFGAAARFLPRIKEEARRWAQPISINQVTIDTSLLGADAGLFGAARLALAEDI